MKKTLIIATTFLLIISTLGCSKETKLEGGEKELVSFTDTKLNISTNDLYEKLKDKYGINFLIDMIDTKILDKEFPDSDSINDYVNIQVNSIKNYYKTETEFLEYINNYGYKNEDELKEYFKLNYKRNLAIKDYLKTLVSDDDINNYYDNKITGDIETKHILIEVKTTSSQTEDEKRTVKEEALKKAKEAIDKLNEGKSFDEVCKEYSGDDATKNMGGLMGFINTLNLDDVSRQELTKLEVGKYSTEALETEYGYEIFMKVSEKDKPKLEDVKTHIIETLADEKLTKDNKLQYKGLEYIRDKYGFSIKDEDLQVYYENTMNNLLNSKES
ncbi:MAG: peptidylprolyl isomerase [Erysipelotrichaceae bacterium]|nr:peptidylprolyl isomerase [Erysipelotrichaceae bacterium]